MNNTNEIRELDVNEVFTPKNLVNEILNSYPINVWDDPTKTWLDPSCGDGNFLVEIKQRLIIAGHDEKHIIENMLYGVEIMQDNVNTCIERLNAINYKHNIVCADATTYNFTFGVKEEHFGNLFCKS